MYPFYLFFLLSLNQRVFDWNFSITTRRNGEEIHPVYSGFYILEDPSPQFPLLFCFLFGPTFLRRRNFHEFVSFFLFWVMGNKTRQDRFSLACIQFVYGMEQVSPRNLPIRLHHQHLRRHPHQPYLYLEHAFAEGPEDFA